MNAPTDGSTDPRLSFAQERTAMARYRTLLALDRTTLAWIRTTLTLATFGFGLAAFFRALQAQAPTPETAHLHQAAIHFGVGLIILGVVSTLLFGIAHWMAVRRLRRGEMPTLTHWPLSLTVATLLCLVALIGLWSLLER